MKKSIFLFFATLLCATSAWGKTIYFKPSDNWKEANAWFQVWDGSNDHSFTETAISGLYQADIKDSATEIYIKRKEPNTNNNWDEGSKTTIGTYNYFYNTNWSNSMSKTNIIGLVTGGHIYFDNSETKWTGNIQFVVGHDSYSRTYEMKQISNTQLWYVDISKNTNHTWGDAKYYGFIASGSKFGDGDWNSSNLKKATSYTKAYTSTYSLNEGSIYYCKMSATANGSTFSIDYKGSKDDIPKHNATQAAKVRNSKTDAYADINGAWPATLKLEGTYLDNNSTAKRSDITSTTSTDDANKRVYGAVRSGKVTHTYANLNEDYHFEGWGTANEPTSTNDSYEYNITANTTVYAFFTKKYPVNFSADANGSVTATANEQALTSGNKVVGGTEVTLTAEAADGYKFTGWSNGETANPYTFTVTEDVDLVANFKATTITLTTGNNDAVIAANIGNTVDVVIERSFTANDGYYTLCVPFNMPASVIGKAYSLGTITEHVAGEGININLKEENELSAGMPYLVLPKANMSELVVENVTIAEDGVAGQGVSNDELNVQIFFQGYYSAPGVTTNGTTEYYVGNNGYLYNGKVEIRGLSGLFTITDTEGNPAKVRARVVTREDAATGLDNITNGENTTIKVIENGQLIIIRNGEKFNAQGVRL